MDRRLIITVTIGVFLIVTLIIALAIVAAKSSDGSTKTQCLTPGCVHAASLVLQAMDQTVQPCDDFYEFACGGFEKSTTIPDDKTRVDTFIMVKDKLREQLRTSMKEPSSPGEPRPFRIAKDLYKTCMNESAIEQTGFEPLRSILMELGGWPVLEGNDWKNDTFDFYNATLKCGDLGYSPTSLTSANDVELENSMERVLQVRNVRMDLMNPTVPREYLIEGLKNEVVKAYFDFMVDIAVALGADEQVAVEELKGSLEFETKLANVPWSTEARGRLGLLNSTITEADAEVLYPHDLARAVKNTPARAMANYIGWRVAQASIRYLTKDLRAREIGFLAILNGQKAREARWKECVDVVADSMPVSIGAMYVRNHFNIDTKKEAEEMTNYLRMGFVEVLEQASWMDEETRTRALEKVAFMGAHIAYPEELGNDTKLEEYYASLKITEDNFLATVLNLKLFGTKNLFEYLTKPTNESNWISYSRASTINAFYYLNQNSLQIPAAILRGNFFHNDRPRYMNYGAIGSVIGHEVTHGFDNKGSVFDKAGSLENWWNSETKEEYLTKTRCMFNQYENYTVQSVGLKLNGFHTIAENIADNGGLKDAYLAYKNWVKKNGPEPTLPGLDYTPQQMFWISAANVWCARYRPELLKLQIKKDEHSPARFRVIGPFSNNPDFSADFNCPLGSAMNPVDKCSVW